MFENIVKILDEYFDFEYHIKTRKEKRAEINKNKKAKNNPDLAVKEKVKSILEKSDIFEFAKNYQKIPGVYFLPVLFKLISELYYDPDLQEQGLKNLEFLAKDDDYYPQKKDHIDAFLYRSINPILTELASKNKQLYQFFEAYAKLTKKNPEINTIFNSLSYIIEERDKIKNLYLNAPMSHLMAHQAWMRFGKIQQSGPGDFKLYFSDWTLKSSQLIESHIKKLLCLLLQIKFFLNGTQIEDIDMIIRQFNTVGRIIDYLNPSRTYENLDRIRIYRNATFHTNLDFIYEEEANNRLILFKDLDGNVELEISIWKFIRDFEKLIIFILTMNYMIGYLLFKREHDGKSIYQVNYEYAKQHGMKDYFKMVLQELKEESWWLAKIL